jgi:hypothetical protein
MWRTRLSDGREGQSGIRCGLRSDVADVADVADSAASKAARFPPGRAAQLTEVADGGAVVFDFPCLSRIRRAGDDVAMALGRFDGSERRPVSSKLTGRRTRSPDRRVRRTRATDSVGRFSRA